MRRACQICGPVRGHDHLGQELHALVAGLALHSQPQRGAVRHRQIASIHAVAHQRLRMEAGAQLLTVNRDLRYWNDANLIRSYDGMLSLVVTDTTFPFGSMVEALFMPVRRSPSSLSLSK